IQAGNDNRHLNLAEFGRVRSLRTRLFSEADFQGRTHASPGEASFSKEDDAVPVPHAEIPADVCSRFNSIDLRRLVCIEGLLESSHAASHFPDECEQMYTTDIIYRSVRH